MMTEFFVSHLHSLTTFSSNISVKYKLQSERLLKIRSTDILNNPLDNLTNKQQQKVEPMRIYNNKSFLKFGRSSLILSVSLVSLLASHVYASQQLHEEDRHRTPSLSKFSPLSPASQRGRPIQQLLENDLDTLGQQLYATRLPLIRDAYNCHKPTIFISYAWESDIKDWVDQQLSRDLKRLGFEVLYDQERNTAGSYLPKFEDKVSYATYVVVVCTPQYVKRYLEHDPASSAKTTGVGREVEKIARRFGNDAQGKILPIYRKGSYQDCVLPLLSSLVALPATDEASYYKTLFDLSQTLFMYDTINAEPINSLRHSFMTEYRRRQQGLSQGNIPLDDLPSSAILTPQSSYHLIDETHRFSSANLERLYTQIYQHCFGSILDLTRFEPRTKSDGLIIDVLKSALSVRSLNLSQAHLLDQHYLALSTMLYDNTSLRQLNLQETPCSEKAWAILTQGLASHETLATFIPPQFSFPLTPAHLEAFYSLLSRSTALHTVHWPFSLTSELGKSLFKLGEKNRTAAMHLFYLIEQELVQSNQVSALSSISSKSPSTTTRPSLTSRLEDSKISASSTSSGSSSFAFPLFNRDKSQMITQQQQLKYLTIADKLDHPRAVYLQAQIHEHNNFKVEAVAAYTRAADLNHPLANLWMGEYWRGVWKKENREPDYGRAYTYYQRAALQGNEESYYRLGRIQEFGKLPGFGLKEATFSYQKAAARGYSEAFITLIRLHSDPNSAVYDLNKAFFYQEQAKLFPEDATVHWHLNNLIQARPHLK